MNYRYFCICALLGTAVACGATDEDKGAEEQPLTDGKSDSFFSPTEHGPMRFEVANPGTISEDAGFHAWTFEIGDGGASVELKTEVSRNLDTVMYLYHRTSTEQSWGRYIAKNDDHGDNIWSLIRSEDLDAGEYRVIVKPFKKALSGGFSLFGTCEGDGCPNAGTDECSPDETTALPTYTQWSAGCAADVLGVLDSEVEFTSSGEVYAQRRCELTGMELRAVNDYIAWWDDIVGFEDSFDWADYGDGIPLEFDVRAHDLGTVVNVDGPGDESGITFIYDNDARLLSAYQHNQSATVDFYCAGAEEAPIEGPSEGCFRDVMYMMPHGDEVGGDSGLVAVEDADELHPALGVAATRYAEQFGIDDLNVEVSFDLLSWSSFDADEAVSATVYQDDISRTYYLMKTYRGEWEVRVEAGPNGVDFVCE